MISTPEPMSPEGLEAMKRVFGEPKASDGRQHLYDALGTDAPISGAQVGEIARAAKQPVTIEVNGVGEVRQFSDGSRYQVTPKGWQKLEDSSNG